MHKRACINCIGWIHMTVNGQNSLKQPWCDNPKSLRRNKQVSASDTCGKFEPWTGDENDPLVPAHQ